LTTKNREKNCAKGADSTQKADFAREGAVPEGFLATSPGPDGEKHSSAVAGVMYQLSALRLPLAASRSHDL